MKSFDRDRIAVLSIVGKYLLFGALWIYFSDTVLESLVKDHHLLTQIAVFKGLAFILFTALLLYFLIDRYAARERRIRSQLEESEARFREMADLLPQTIYETDLSGKLTFANRQAFETFGYRREEFDAGLNIIDMVAPAHRKNAQDNVGRLLSGEKSLAHEYAALKRDGSTFPVIIHSTLKIKDGATVGLRGVVVDLTKYKEIESQLAQSQKMEAIGTLAGGIAHDFNNLLSAIIGYTELAEMRTQDPDTKGHLESVLNAANRASELVKQILTFSRRTEIVVAPVAIRQPVEEALKLLRASIPSTVRISTELTSTWSVLADPGEIHRVIVNLCTNAAQAMKDTIGGELDVSLADVTVDPAQASLNPDLTPGDYVRLTVRDNGIGMTREVRERIFEPFFTTKTGHSTGMGLSVVHGIVKARGGAITVETEPGCGSTFTIYLPRVDSAGEAPREERREPRRGSGRILLVEDEPLVAGAFEGILRNLGYEVAKFTESREALEYYRQNPGGTDLVLTDLTMPGLTGAQLAAEIRKTDPALPIILTTGYGQPFDPEVLKTLNIARILGKPAQKGDIAHAVREALVR